MSFVLRKLNQVQQASLQIFGRIQKKTDNRPTRELRIYQEAPRVNPADTRSTVWVLPLALDFSLKQNGQDKPQKGRRMDDNSGERKDEEQQKHEKMRIRSI